MAKVGKFSGCTAALALILSPMANASAQNFEDIEDEFEFEEPEVEEPEVEEPEVEEPEVEEPGVVEPEVEEPEVEEPEVKEPEAEEVEVEEPEVEEPEGEDAASESIDDDFGDEDEIGEEEDSLDDRDEAETDDGATPDNAAAEILSGEDWLAELAQSQDPEFDEDGNPVRRGEVIALDLSNTARLALLSQGFVYLETNKLDELGAELTILAAPTGLSARAALAAARTTDPGGVYDLGHYYALPYQPSTGRSGSRTRSPDGPAIAGNLRIGLIDTNVRNADLPSRVRVESRNFGQPGTQGGSDHGTAVASILAANGAGDLVVANVFDTDGRRDFTSAQSIGNALAWLLERRVGVVNISLAGPRNAVLDTLVSRAVSRGTVIIAAAGNGGPAASPAYPAALPGVIAVTAVDGSHHIYRYANRGDYVRLATYGVRVPVILGDAEAIYVTGTSFASPRVAARLTACIANGGSPEHCVRQLEVSAQDLGDPGRDNVYGFGFVN